MTLHPIVIGTMTNHCRSSKGERQSPSPASQHHARQPIPYRIPNEFYPTPPAAVRALLSVEQFEGSIWEPACGEGAIANVLREAGHRVVSTDLHDYGFGIAGVDFLNESTARGVHIVTNPPYGFGLADAFVSKALELARATGGKVAMLLNLAALCHPSRTLFWRRYPPARIYAIDGVVCWPSRQYGPPPAAFLRHRHCWTVWRQDHRGGPEFGWLSAADFQ